MTLFDESTRERVTAKLIELGAAKSCPRCGNPSFSLAQGYFIQVLQDNTESLQLSGNAIPTAVLTCTNCGYVIQHAIGTLGLMQPEEPDKIESAK